jgi:release factor glutamine methyltransferase
MKARNRFETTTNTAVKYLSNHEPVYEPAEDSELLGSVVRTHARGRALDIGTGSGYLARRAHDAGCTVTALDVNPAVIDRLRRERVPFRLLLSDRFARVRGRFDTIICNPPYLPNDEELHDSTLHGGPNGYEYIVSVIEDVGTFLAPDGQFLFLISTLTKPSVIEHALKRHGFVWSVVAREKLFMEELLVYRANLLFRKPATLLGEGWRGSVYAVSPSVVVKVTDVVRARKEARFLQQANSKRIGPRFIRVTPEGLFMRRVRGGERFDVVFARSSHVRKTRLARKLLAQARVLDELGIAKKEFTRPGTNVLVTASDRVVLLDFERASYAKRPGNVTQAAQYFARVLHADREAVRVACVKYKRTRSRTTFRALLQTLGV